MKRQKFVCAAIQRIDFISNQDAVCLGAQLIEAPRLTSFSWFTFSGPSSKEKALGTAMTITPANSLPITVRAVNLLVGLFGIFPSHSPEHSTPRRPYTALSRVGHESATQSHRPDHRSSLWSGVLRLVKSHEQSRLLLDAHDNLTANSDLPSTVQV